MIDAYSEKLEAEPHKPAPFDEGYMEIILRDKYGWDEDQIDDLLNQIGPAEEGGVLKTLLGIFR